MRAADPMECMRSFASLVQSGPRESDEHTPATVEHDQVLTWPSRSAEGRTCHRECAVSSAAIRNVSGPRPMRRSNFVASVKSRQK
ncbi:MAG: hypothetical protein JWN72_37 [Thermoleophilia bacterium]|nr:hypothetical protein [Thermoleophilia bacterium]